MRFPWFKIGAKAKLWHYFRHSVWVDLRFNFNVKIQSWLWIPALFNGSYIIKKFLRDFQLKLNRWSNGTFFISFLLKLKCNNHYSTYRLDSESIRCVFTFSESWLVFSPKISFEALWESNSNEVFLRIFNRWVCIALWKTPMSFKCRVFLLIYISKKQFDGFTQAWQNFSVRTSAEFFKAQYKLNG